MVVVVGVLRVGDLCLAYGKDVRSKYDKVLRALCRPNAVPRTRTVLFASGTGGSRIDGMAEGDARLVTLLFTDLVGSTELLARAGDDEAQRVLRAHRRVLGEAVAAHGGHEVKWLGDGLMVAFPSAAEAVGCAIEMQQMAQYPVEGEQLAIRVGLSAGEALRDAEDYFGTSVVVAKRLCDRADGGQVLSTATVAGLLAGRAGFRFVELGKLNLKGIPEPVAACEVRYETAPSAATGPAPRVVGRDRELAGLTARWETATGGRGGLVTVTGEAGIGKTTVLGELAERARRQGALVLVGRCFECEWAPPFGPFADAVAGHLGTVDAGELRADLGPGAPFLARLVPQLGEVLADLPAPVEVQPDEERFRLIDAMAKFLVAQSQRRALLLCLDDLQWADKASVAMLRHVARFASGHRMLVVGAYRDVDVGPAHPLTDALQALRRETDFDHVALESLGPEGVHALLETLAGQDLPVEATRAWAREVGGNPFFIAEMVRHLLETGDLYREPNGRWAITRPIRDLTVPEGVRDVLARRLSRLSDAANKLLGVAATFESTFGFDVVSAVAGLDEVDALDALDEAVTAEFVRPAGRDNYTFASGLIRHSIYDGIVPSRQLRLHRRVAETLELAYGKRPSPGQAAEIASQYHRSRDLPGAHPGVEPALIAAGHAQANGAPDEAAVFLRMALDMLVADDDRRPGLLGRLAIVLAWALRFDEARPIAAEAGGLIAETEGKQAAAEYLSDAAYVCAMAGGTTYSWDLASAGLSYAGPHDLAWARLLSFDHERRAAEDPDHPGIPIDSSERRESARILRAARLDPLGPAPMEGVFDTRHDARGSANLTILLEWAGEYSHCLPLFAAEGEEAERRGQVARAARAWSGSSICHAALGHLDDADADLERARHLAARLGAPIFFVLTAQDARAAALNEGWSELIAVVGPLSASRHPALAWALGLVSAYAARANARLGQRDDALHHLGQFLAWLERAPAWTIGFPLLAAHAAETLWLLERVDHAGVIEGALRSKVIQPDFRFPMVDGRLALAQICALHGRHEEAASWFDDARRVLTEQDAHPLLAIVDFDQALMHARRADPGDGGRARLLVDAAGRRFKEIGMTGWVRRADDLSDRLGGV